MALYAAYLPSSRTKSKKSQIKPSQYLSPNYGSSSSYRSTSPQRYHTLDTSRLLHREKSPTRYGKDSTIGYGLDREKTWYNKDALYGCMSSSYSSHQDKSMPSYTLQRERSPGRYILERNVAKSVRTKGFVPSRNTVWTDLSLKYPRHTSHYCTGRNEPYVEGWRSRLAREAQQQRRPRSDRRWHYADDEEAEEGFSVRTNRGCGGEAPHDSVVSRTRTIQLEALAERPEAKDAQTQVDEVELELSREQEERRLKRTFLSSRHHSYYDRYLSPMPWRGRYSTPQSSPLSSPQVVEPPVIKKETGRSPSSEEEGETGYDTDSCYDTEGFLTDRSCALSLRSLTPYGDFSFTEDSVSSGIYLSEGPRHQRSISESTSTIAEPLTDFSEPEGTGYLDAKDLCFRFLTTAADGSSQRDSGFAELLQPPQKGTDCSSVPEDEDDFPPPADVQFVEQTDVFVGDVRDVDLLLSNEPFGTLEDFERFVNRYRDDVRKSHCCQGESKGDKKRPKELKLDIGYVGRCRDIDEVLGWTPEPPSPVDTSKLDDCTLQLFRYSGSEGDYGSYLDLESTIDEQAEDFEDFHSNRKNTVILRTQLSVRVHSIIEKLLSCTGRELRRALFSLKQIFQDDKDLVHEFVQNDGLACLIKVGSEADQNYQNYILRALGQVMLYVDGMNGVIEHIETIQWLYSLIASKYRLVVKTTLKLLLVFVEYSESNSQLLINTVCLVDSHKGSIPWSNIMNLLKEKDSADMELLVYAVTLINKTLNSIPDQDTYYDMVDSLEEQGMEHVIQYYMSKQGTDLDLLQQLHIYEAVLKHEDGVPDTKPLPLDARFRRNRTSVSDENERRKSRRHSVGTVNGNSTPVNHNNHHHPLNFHSRSLENTPEESPYWQDRNQNIIETKTNHHQHNGHVNGNGHIETNGHGVTPSLRRRRERDARNKSLIKQQEENGKTFHRSDSLSSSSSDTLLNDNTPYPSRLDNVDMNRQKEESIPHYGNNKKAWMLSMMYAKSQEEDNNSRNVSEPPSPQLEKVSISHQQVSYSSPSKIPVKEVVVPSGIVGRAKDGLASGGTGAASPPPPKQPFDPDVKWEQLVKTVRRPLLINGLDFTDLRSDEDDDVLEYLGPPEGCSEGPPPPPLPPGLGPPPPPPPNGPPPPAPPSWTKRNQPDKTNKTVHPAKTKKTVKLFWREVREDRVGVQKAASSIWDELAPVHLDTQKLEHLFQNRAKEVPTKEKGAECVASKKSEVIVLDTKRSNAINIAMTKLPPPRTIKTAVLKMDSTIVNREGIEKVLGMLPTEDEKSRISEAQLSNPDVPLGSAEQFLLTLASISELEARLRLWAFRLDYDSLEREVAEPLMDLKQAMKEIEGSETLRVILSTLRSVGNFLNGVEIKGFHIEYLSKVPEVKDTVQKHSLLHHLCHIVMERFPNSSDLYSELGSVTRASKIDYCEVSKALNKMESECKASWDYLKAILKHDCNITLKVRTTEFLTDCAERIIVLKVIHRRMLNRYHKFLLYLGCSGSGSEQELSVQRCCRILSEFALEYRTTRERVLQQIEKKANHRQRNKTRGKMITDMDRFKTKEQLADQELRQLLNGSGGEGQKWGTVPTTRGRVRSQLAGGSLGRHSTPPVAKDEGGVDEDAILESLVKTATAQPHKSEPRIRKKARYGDRKSLRRTLKGGLELSEEERNLLTTMTT